MKQDNYEEKEMVSLLFKMTHQLDDLGVHIGDILLKSLASSNIKLRIHLNYYLSHMVVECAY